MRHYQVEDFEGDENEVTGCSQKGKYAIRRDIARNGSFKKAKKETHKPRPPRHLENTPDFPQNNP